MHNTRRQELVEPDDINVLLIEDMLEDGIAITQGLFEGELFYYFKIVREYTLKGALEALKKYTFHVILLDLGLPDSKGLKAVKEIHTRYPDIPVVIISGYSDMDMIQEALRSGAQEFLVKGEFSAAAIRQGLYQAIVRKKMELAHQKENKP